MLPTAARSAAAGASATESAKPSTAAKSSATAEAAASESSAAPAEDLGKKKPEKQAAQRSQEDDQYDDNNCDDPADRNAAAGFRRGPSRGARLSGRELNSRIRGNDICNPAGDQLQGVVVISASHQRNRFALKTAHLAIGQNGFQPVTYFDAGSMIPYNVQDQNAAICRFAADAPFLEESNGIALNVGAVEGIDGDQGDLSVSFFVDLPADVVYLRDGALVKNVCEIVDVTRRLEL